MRDTFNLLCCVTTIKHTQILKYTSEHVEIFSDTSQQYNVQILSPQSHFDLLTLDQQLLESVFPIKSRKLQKRLK